VINEPILAKLEEHFRYLLDERWGAQLLEFNGEPDHVHMLIALNPKIGPSVLVNNLKTVSSRIIRRDFAEHVRRFYWKPVFWSRTYCLITCGGAPLSVLKQYIENQKGV
jgi:putative transposase